MSKTAGCSSVTESAASLGLLVVCARTGTAMQVESPTSAARRVTLIVIPGCSKAPGEMSVNARSQNAAEKLNCTLPSLPARRQRRSQAAQTIDAFSDGASARGSRCAVPIHPCTSTIQQNLARALRATTVGVGWRRERSLRRARKQGYRSRLLARGIVADPHKVLAARQRRVLRGDRRSERSAADDLIYLHTG